MKKMITMILMATALCFVGCEKRPSEYDHLSEGWGLWAAGIVDKANTIVTQNSRKFVVEFKGDIKVEGDDFHNFNDIIEGTEGSLYRFYTGCGNVYMWVPKDGPAPTIKPVAKKEDKTNASYEPVVNATTRAITPAKYINGMMQNISLQKQIRLLYLNLKMVCLPSAITQEQKNTSLM